VNTISGKIDLRRPHLLGAMAMTAVAPLGMLVIDRARRGLGLQIKQAVAARRDRGCVLAAFEGVAHPRS